MVEQEEVTVKRRRQEAIARQEAAAEDLREADLERDKLEGLDQSARAYLEGHDIRALVERLHSDDWWSNSL